MPSFYNRIKARKFSTAADTAVEISPSSSATPNFTIDAGGKLNWSSGSAAADTNLYRSASNVLKTDDSFSIASGQTYKIDGDDVLTATSLGSTVVSSSLTSVGTLSSLSAATPTFSGPLTSSGLATFSSGITAATPTFTGPLTSSGTSTFSGSLISSGTLTAATPNFSGPMTISGRTDIQQIREVVNNISISGGTLTCNYNTGGIFYVDAGVGATTFTIDVTNLPTDNNYAVSVTILVKQGSTQGIPTTIKANGSTVTHKWANGNTSPTASAQNKIDIFTFTLHRVGGAWVILGSYSLNY